jgi:hypothetical protein
VHLESGNEVVILEGRAGFSDDGSVLEEFVAAYNTKYNWDFTPERRRRRHRAPHRAFGWVCDPTGLDRGAIYNATGTRWDFANQPAR